MRRDPMPTIGLFEYPHLTLTEAIEAARSSADPHGVRPDRREDRLLRDLLAYGVVRSNNGATALTPLGRRLTEPAGRDDFQRAVAEAIFNVPLLRELWGALAFANAGGDDALRAAIVGATGVMVVEADQHAPAIQRLLAEIPPNTRRRASAVLARLRESLAEEAGAAPQEPAPTPRATRSRASPASTRLKSREVR
jgi:hypothetical protein